MMKQHRILYEDNHILVCHKPAGIATQTARIGQADMVSEMENYLMRNLTAGGSNGEAQGGRRGNVSGRPHIYVVHRLDQPVEGILVFAKQQAAAAALSAQAAGEDMEKEYLALVCDLRDNETAGGLQGDGQPAKRIQTGCQMQSGILTDYLLKDAKTNMSRVVPPEVKGAKEARLSYEILPKTGKTKEDILEGLSEEAKMVRKNAIRQEAAADWKQVLSQVMLARIRLYTGRHHQIRVQMANAGMPLLGDRKYAPKEAAALSERLGIREIALCAYRLSFCHPKTKERLCFEITPEGAAFRGIRF